MFEVVHTLNIYYDGPRRGIADFQGLPYLYESEWNDVNNMEADTFLLMPIDSTTLSLALEDWNIWRRWETAFHRGTATADTHPALPEDRERHHELEQMLEPLLRIDPATAIRKKAEFQIRNDPDWNGLGIKPLEVRWQDA